MGVEAPPALAEARAGVDRLSGKKQKISPVTRPPNFERYEGLSIVQWHRTMGEIMNRRAVLPREGVHRPKPPEGEEGALNHWRRGLAGAVCDWAAGSMDNVVILLIRLVNHFKVSSCLVVICGTPHLHKIAHMLTEEYACHR